MKINLLRRAIVKRYGTTKELPYLCDDVLLIILEQCSLKVNLVCRRWYVVSHRRRMMKIVSDWRCQVILTLYPKASIHYTPKMDGKEKMLIVPKDVVSDVIIDGTHGQLPGLQGRVNNLTIKLVSHMFPSEDQMEDFIGSLIGYFVRRRSGRVGEIWILNNDIKTNVRWLDDISQAGIKFTVVHTGPRGMPGIQGSCNEGGPRGWIGGKPNKRQLKKNKAYQQYRLY